MASLVRRELSDKVYSHSAIFSNKLQDLNIMTVSFLRPTYLPSHVFYDLGSSEQQS